MELMFFLDKEMQKKIENIQVEYGAIAKVLPFLSVLSPSSLSLLSLSEGILFD